MERNSRRAVQMGMRRLFTCISCLLVASLAFPAAAATVTDGPVATVASTVGSRPASPEELAQLKDALLKVARDQSRWAYTETMVVKDDKGRIKEARVVRFDPSKPYAEQYTPLEIGGQPPTEKELKEYRQKGEKRGERLERAEVSTGGNKRPTLSEAVDLSHALVVREDERAVDYELPLRKLDGGPFPPEKFQVIARFDRTEGRVQTVAVRLREPVRAKLVVKINSGDATIDFTTVDPKFAPAMTAVHGDASGSILFINVGANFALTRTDLKRVKPYGDRFGVEIGPTRALDF